MTPLILEFVKIVPNMQGKACFDFGLMEQFEVRPDEEVITRIPFDECAFVYKASPTHKGCVLVKRMDQPDAFEIRNLVISNGKLFQSNRLLVESDGKGFDVFDLDEQKPVPDDRAVTNVIPVGHCLHRLYRSEQQAFIPTVKSNSFINKSRIAKGKQPSQYDWRTVVITNAVKEKAESKGGTHATPRLHTRRGHFRNHPSGKRIWVRDCLVGDPDKGVVDHDYKIGVET